MPQLPERSTAGRGLVRRFTLISLAITVVAALVVAYAMGRLVESYVLGQAANEASGRLGPAALPLPDGAGFDRPLAADVEQRLDTAVRERLLEPPVERVALWDQAERRRYETGPAALAPRSDLVRAALAGALQYDIVRGPNGRQLRMIQPLRREGTVVGAVEVEQDFEALATHIGEMQGFAAVSVVGFSIALYLLLLQLVAGAAHRLAAEAAENARLTAAERHLFATVQQNEQRFRALVQNASDIIVILKPDGTVQYASPSVQRVLGYSPAAVQGNTLMPLLNPDDATRVGRLLTEVVTGAALPGVVEFRLLHSDKTWRHFEAVCSNLLDDPSVAGIVLNAWDVTERKQMEEQLLRAQRLEAAGRVAAQVAHDFNNLLAPLAGFPELIKMQLPADHPAISYCDTMLTAAQRMADINSDLLTLGRRGHFELGAIDLNLIVREAVQHVGPPAETIAIELDLHPDLLPVRGSAAPLLRVVSNLLVNAQDAVDAVGRIDVQTENVYLDLPVGRYARVEAGEYVKLEVRDNGSGIPAEIQDKIFDAFFTTKQAGQRRGTGLGLSVVQSIVDDHGGYLDLHSEAGRGTTFSIYLPIARDAPLNGAARPATGGSEAILVVDDDEVQRAVTSKLLETLGYRVSTIASGEGAIDFLRQEPTDLLILDMIMPGGIDGAETYRQALEVQPAQRAIIASGLAESDRVRQAQLLGAGAYVRKPLSLDVLARAVRDELDRER